MPAHATVIPAEEAAGTHCAHCAEVTGQEEGGAARPGSVRTREATEPLPAHGHRRSLPRAACGASPGCGHGRWPAASAEREAEPGQGTARRREVTGTGWSLFCNRLQAGGPRASSRPPARTPMLVRQAPSAAGPCESCGGSGRAPGARPDRRPSAPGSGPPDPGGDTHCHTRTRG